MENGNISNIWPPDDEQWSETSIQMYISMMAMRSGYLFHADGNGNYVHGSVAGKKKLAGARAGWPDLVFLLANGMAVWIELKTMDGPVSAVQKELHKRMADNGHLVRVVRARNGADGWKQVREMVGR